MSVTSAYAKTPQAAPAPATTPEAAQAPRTPARPAVSRLAARRVQALLRVGAAGDSYEREADAIARDLAGPAPALRNLEPGAHTPAVGPNGGSAPIPEVERAGGGRPLPPVTRAFFEEHLGHDFSGVRVHDGLEGAAVARSVGAAALTYGDHVWLGDGVGSGPSHVLAHELVHVAQQSQAPPVARRALPYWEATGADGRGGGTRTHAELLPQIGRHGSVYTEAPIPMADRNGPEWGKRGSADIYAASTTIGINFTGHQAPVLLRSFRDTKKDGERVDHRGTAAPIAGHLQSIRRVADAPTNIRIADLKPQSGSLPADRGPAQVAGYVQGINDTAREVNEMVGAGGTTWHLRSAAPMSRGQLGRLVPPEFRAQAVRSGSSSQPERGLVLRQGRRPVQPLTRARGRVAIVPDPVNAGVLNYVWVPSDVGTITLPEAARRLGTEVVNRLLRPLRRSPVQQTGAPRRGRRYLPVGTPGEPRSPRSATTDAPGRAVPAWTGSPVTRRLPARRVQRRQRDDFDLRRWREDHRRLRGERRGAERRDQLDAPRQASAIADAHRGIVRAGVPLPELPAAMATAARTSDRIDFWTGSQAPVLARFRSVFGRLFVRVANAYDRMRERFQQRARRPAGGGGGGGIPGAAVKVAVTVLRAAMRVIVRRTMQILQASLVAGVTRKIESLIGEDNIAELRERVEELDALRQQMEAEARGTVEALFQRAFGPYEEMVDRFDQIQSLMTGFMRIVNLVRWGARVIACGFPPLLGCLWGLAQGVLEELAAVVIGTCWFQRKVTPLLLRLDLVRRLPARLAAMILDTMREVVPAPMQDVFGAVEVPEITADEVECDPWGSGGELDESQRALMRMQERLGEERFQAWLHLSRTVGVPDDAPLTAERANEITDAILESGATEAQLRQYAWDASLAPHRIPTDVRTFLRRMGARQLAPAILAETPAGPGVGEEYDVPGASSEEEETGAGAGPATQSAVGTPVDEQLRDRREIGLFSAEILSGVGRGDFLGARLELTVRVSGQEGGRRFSTVIRPLRVRVGPRRPVTVDGRRTLRVTLILYGRGRDQVFELSPPLLGGRLERIGIQNRAEIHYVLPPRER